MVYGEYARTRPDLMKVVAVAEPMVSRRRKAAERFGLPPEAQFATFQELLARPRLAEAAINGTMDPLHRESTLGLLDRGYHVLVEKPIAQTEAHVREMIAAADRAGRLVMVGHVLRSSPFYATIKKLIDTGRLGRILSMRTTESIDYGHMATSFIRGKWNRTEVSPILMAKCCHDLDILAWYKSGVPVRRVSSFGGQTFFRPDLAPAGSADRCTNGCTIERSCPYSAQRIYVEKGFYKWCAWQSIEESGDLSIENKLRSLATDNPYGRCVWRTDCNQVDQQTVQIEFADGTQAVHCLYSNAGLGRRDIYIVGAKGDLFGDSADGKIQVCTPDMGDNRNESIVEWIDTQAIGGEQVGGHGGGDQRLIADFIAAVRGENETGGVSRIADSLIGHQIGFAAEQSMRQGTPVAVAAPI